VAGAPLLCLLVERPSFNCDRLAAGEVTWYEGGLSRLISWRIVQGRLWNDRRNAR